MLKKISLRAKAIAFACAIGISPMLVLGAIAYSTTDRDIVGEKMQAQQFRAFSLTDKVNRFFFERYGDVQIIANLSFLRNPKASTVLTPQEKQAALNKFIEVYRVYDSIAVFELNGDLIVKSSGEAPSNIRDLDYFQKVIKTGQPVISSPQISQTSGEVVILFAAPVRDINTGKTIAVVRTRMPLAILYNLLADFGKNDEWHLINNSSGQLFAALETKQIGREVKVDFPALSQLQATNKTGTVISLETFKGVKQLITYAPFNELQGLPRLNWSVILASDTTKVFSTQNNLSIALLIGTGVTALIVSGIAVVVAGRTTELIKGVTTAIAVSSNDIASTVEQQEQAVNEQASSVNQTTTTMDELGASSLESAEQAEASASAARQALTLAETGTKTVQQTMQGIDTLKNKVGAIAEQILRLSEQTGQIASISDLVSDLANQTNMLALNAAVEAARAGESGKGFSVVAGEIRKLADQSKKSADKIGTLIADIQAAMNSTIMVTDEGTKTASEGIKLTQETVETFVGVSDAISNVFLNNQQISLNAKQQAVAVQEVVASINSLNLGAQETVSGIIQVRANTEQLKQAANQLKALV